MFYESLKFFAQPTTMNDAERAERRRVKQKERRARKKLEKKAMKASARSGAAEPSEPADSDDDPRAKRARVSSTPKAVSSSSSVAKQTSVGSSALFDRMRERLAGSQVSHAARLSPYTLIGALHCSFGGSTNNCTHERAFNRCQILDRIR